MGIPEAQHLSPLENSRVRRVYLDSDVVSDPISDDVRETRRRFPNAATVDPASTSPSVHHVKPCTRPGDV
jgi:hypothetical protein